MMALFNDGNMQVFNEKEVSEEQLNKMIENRGLLHTYSFGPILVKEGISVEDFKKYSIRVKNPRTGFGMIDKNHYIFITVDARQEGYSIGMTLNEFAQEFVKRGCKYAYNLDGGGSASMYFNGRVVNRPCDIGGERSVSDILYIGR
jgi:exopolysaccharide biosynthesis protein